jgi:hypothetical protein
VQDTPIHQGLDLRLSPPSQSASDGGSSRDPSPSLRLSAKLLAQQGAKICVFFSESIFQVPPEFYLENVLISRILDDYGNKRKHFTETFFSSFLA